jgi:MFS transporter, UMF1 family
MPASRLADAKPEGGWRSVAAWCLFDWANTAVSTVILTFVFSVYFAKGIVGDEAEGSSLWAYAIGVSGIIVALLAPILGAIADHAGRCKPWLALLVILTVLPTALLWFARPEPAMVPFALVMTVLSCVAVELGQVFYNAMLPGIAPPSMTGRVSGWGWGLGYIGGLVCLILCLLVFVQPDPPLFGLDKAAQEPVRATSVVVAAWFAVFSLPLFLFSRDRGALERLRPAAAVRAGFAQLAGTIRYLPRRPALLKFLVASALYRDGLGTLFAVGGLYAAGTFGMSFNEILIFAIGLNITAGLGAIGFAWVDDWLGARPTVLISLAGLIVIGTAVLLVDDKTVFMGLAMALGIFMGPAQAASRSLLARLSPRGMETEMFGLYALTGKSVAFLGPMIFGLVTAATGSQRWGMSTIILFLLAGAVLLMLVRLKPEAAE